MTAFWWRMVDRPEGVSTEDLDALFTVEHHPAVETIPTGFRRHVVEAPQYRKGNVAVVVAAGGCQSPLCKVMSKWKTL